MSALRPLPARPNLEFERKRAKALLKSLRASRPDVRLADVQLIIAREYGFASWPTLVRYFADAERQAHAARAGHEPQFYEALAKSLLGQLQQRRGAAARAIAAYVPRLYGKPLSEVFATAVTDDEARLAAVRQYGFPSWDVMLERTAEFLEQRRQRIPPARVEPMMIQFAADRGSLESTVAKFPDQINEMLCGGMRMQPETVRFLLERGADPNWVAPNGIPVLEHALIRYWNGAAVDVLAERATPRKALWIAAGLGDVAGVRRFLDAGGSPTPAARKLRPDFIAVGQSAGVPQYPGAGDEEILMEAFFVAVLNGRSQVIAYFASRGFNVNSLVWETPVLNVAAGNAWLPAVEALVRCGADPDIRGWHPDSTAREMARMSVELDPENADRRRVAELLGLDPVAILAERDARPAPEPVAVPELVESLELAGDDAFRQGKTHIDPESLLWGMLRRPDGLGEMYFTRLSRMEFERFRLDMAGRLLAATDRIERPPMTMSDEAQALMRAAIGLAKERRREELTSAHLLLVLLRDNKGPAAGLLSRYGASADALIPGIERSL